MKNKFFFKKRKKYFLKTFLFLFSVGFCEESKVKPKVSADPTVIGEKSKTSGETGLGETKQLHSVRVNVSCLDSQNNEIKNFQLNQGENVSENCVKMKISFFGDLEKEEISIIRNKIEELLKNNVKVNHVMFDFSILKTVERVKEIKEIFTVVPKNINLRIKLLEEILPLEYLVRLMSDDVFRFEKIKVLTKKRFKNLEKISGLIEKSRMREKDVNRLNNKTKTKMLLVREVSGVRSELKIVVKETLTPEQSRQNRNNF